MSPPPSVLPRFSNAQQPKAALLGTLPSGRLLEQARCRHSLWGARGMKCHPLNLSGESHRPLTPIHLKSIAIHLPFLARYFCKSMPSSWQKVVYTPPICIAIRHPFVSRYFCRSIRVRGRWDTPHTFHQFISRELFLIIISSWFTSKKSGRIISRNLSDVHLLPHLVRLT